MHYQSKNYRLQFLDTSGQQRFRTLISNFIRDANCTLIIFDVTSTNILEEIEMWNHLSFQDRKNEGLNFLVGNKIDLKGREVTEVQAKQLAKKWGMFYFEVSAKTGQNIP